MESKESIQTKEIYLGKSPKSTTPYFEETVTISKAEHIQLKLDSRAYKTAHSRSVEREKALKEQVRTL